VINLKEIHACEECIEVSRKIAELSGDKVKGEQVSVYVK
jgi:hypothetical protein